MELKVGAEFTYEGWTHEIKEIQLSEDRSTFMVRAEPVDGQEIDNMIDAARDDARGI